MKIYTITNIQSNICEVDLQVFTNKEKALIQWDKDLRQEVQNFKDVDAIEFNEHNPMEEDTEEFKRYAYDDGSYFNALEFRIHKVK